VFCFCFADGFANDSFVRATNFWFLVLLFQRKGHFRLILLLKPLRLRKARMEMTLMFLEKKVALLRRLPLLLLESQA
jgi:hypothetical protein